MTGEGGLVEVQATAERTPLSRAHLDELLVLAADRHRRPARGPGRGARRRGALVLATRNAHKVREFERLLPGVEIAPLPDERHARGDRHDLRRERADQGAQRGASATGQPAFADDSGIEAEALDGRPGVYTARFAGPDATDGENLAKLHREAPAGCGAAVRVRDRLGRLPTATEQLFEGTCDGTLAERPARRRAASATTRCSSPASSRTARWPS